MVVSRTRAAVIALLLVYSPAISSQMDPGESIASGPVGRPIMGRHLKAKGVPNFGEVTPTLYRGGQPTKEGFETLARMGMQIVVDTGRSRRDEALIKSLGMSYIPLPWYCPFPKDAVFARFIEITRKNSGKRIFVHCRLGADRTGMMIAAYRMAVEHWPSEKAMEEMHEFGYRGMHHIYCPGLGRYEKHFGRRLQNDPVFRNIQ